jgi:hypothetical protein
MKRKISSNDMSAAIMRAFLNKQIMVPTADNVHEGDAILFAGHDKPLIITKVTPTDMGVRLFTDKGVFEFYAKAPYGISGNVVRKCSIFSIT